MKNIPTIIDSSPQNTKILQLGKKSGQYYLQTARILETPPVRSDLPKSLTHKIAIVIPNHLTLIKTIEVEKNKTTEEIAQYITQHAEHYFNRSAKDIMIDFEILGQSEKHENNLDVRIVAGDKPYIENTISFWRKLKYQIVAVDVEALALERAVIKTMITDSSEPQILFIIRINTNSFFIGFFIAQEFVHIHEELISETENCENIAKQICQYLHTQMTPNYTAQKILLCGDHIKLDELRRQINIAMSMNTEIINYKEIAPAFFGAYGLALRYME